MSDTHKLETIKRKARDAFTTFEHKEGSRLIHTKDIPTVIRCIGINPSEQQMAQVCDLIKEGTEDGQDGQLVPFERFQAVVVPWVMHNEAQLVREDFHRIMQALKAFDPNGKGYIDNLHMKTTLMTQGELMGAEEVIKMLAHCADSEGRIWYEDYAASLATDGREL